MQPIESADRRIERVARMQHGCFNLEQASVAGFTESMVHRRLAGGRWLRLESGVYALASAPSTWERQYKAAELSAVNAALCRLPAGKVHALAGFKVVRPEIYVSYTSTTRNRLAVVHRILDVPTTVVNGIRVTSVAQTLFDVVTKLRLDRLELAMDGALLERKVTVDELTDRRHAFESSRRPGIKVWRALVDERSEEGWVPPESQLEQALATVLARLPGDPIVLRQVTMPWWRPGEGRVDSVLPEWRTIVEADGRRWHARVKDFDADRWRDNVAQAHGYRVLRFTHLHLTARPAEVRDLILGVRDWKVSAA
jgi:very-short-patch-repair endonuclease